MITAVIPARGGSKRIPGKNIRLFAGKPMIARSIEAALESKIFDQVIVSTESEEIAEVARSHGAQTPFARPAELADDFTGLDTVFLHALEWHLGQGHNIEYACCILATAPLLQARDLIRGYELVREKQPITAFSVTSFPYPILRALKIKTSGQLEMFWPEYFKRRSQDLPEAYHDAGQFYWVTVEKYLQARRMFTDDSLPVLLPRDRVVDIDTPEDWEVAERLYQAVHETPGE